jgi:glycosyltransferase involved in cell wall biosynthesis
VRGLKRHFNQHRFDLVHTHNIYPHLYGTLAARLAGVPFVVNTRHGQRVGQGWKSRILFRVASYWVDRVVAVSDDAASLCVEKDGLPLKKVSRIWNGIDISEFAFRGPIDSPIAICVARLVPEKDHANLIQAISIASRTVPNLKLRIVGDGLLRLPLEKLVVEIKASEHVEFLGEQENVPELLATSGFYVSSSLSEGVSLTILEAMAVGLPVIATSVGGNPEIVVESTTGMLVPASNPQMLANAIIEMCRCRADWQTMGENGRRRVAECFDVRTMTKNYEALYQTLHKKRGR